MWSIQQQLLRDDAFLIGAFNADPRDHARRATTAITASSQRANGAAANVASGQTRAVVTGSDGTTIGHGGGVPASQAINGTNRWISSGLPASITLAMDADLNLNSAAGDGKPTPVVVKQVPRAWP